MANAGGRRFGTEPINLFLTLGRHRSLFVGWLWFAGRLMPGGSLPRRDTELLILRVAHLTGSHYEFEHHRRIGRRAGLTDQHLLDVLDGPAATGWTVRERDLLSAADQLCTDGTLDDAQWQALRSHLPERQCLEFCFLISHYQMLATVIRTLRIQSESPRLRQGRLRHERR